jgi:hypothetical protein
MSAEQLSQTWRLRVSELARAPGLRAPGAELPTFPGISGELAGRVAGHNSAVEKFRTAKSALVSVLAELPDAELSGANLLKRVYELQAAKFDLSRELLRQVRAG